MPPHTDPALSAEAVAPGSHHGSLIPGAPHNISRNDTRLQQVVLNAAYLYNNQSNDAFLFKPSAILTAQQQVQTGNASSAIHQRLQEMLINYKCHQ